MNPHFNANPGPLGSGLFPLFCTSRIRILILHATPDPEASHNADQESGSEILNSDRIVFHFNWCYHFFSLLTDFETILSKTKGLIWALVGFIHRELVRYRYPYAN